MVISFINIVSAIVHSKFSYQDDYYRKRLIDKYETIESLIGNLEKGKYAEKSTRKKIIFRNEFDFGLTTKEFVQKMGRPTYVVKNDNIEGHSIFLYKVVMGEIKTRCEVHFLNNSFFMANYSFRNISDEDIKWFFNIIHEKYLDPGTNRYSTMVISDRDENIILLNQQDYSFSISYSNWKNDEITQLKKIVEKLEIERLLKKEEKNTELKNFL